jgi:hypothetical protein
MRIVRVLGTAAQQPKVFPLVCSTCRHTTWRILECIDRSPELDGLTILHRSHVYYAVCEHCKSCYLFELDN